MKHTKAKLKNILSEGDLRAIGSLVGGLFDEQIGVLAAKKDLKEEIKGSELRLKAYMHEGFEAVLRGMDSLADRFVEKEKFEKLVEWAREVGEKVGVKPKI